MVCNQFQLHRDTPHWVIVLTIERIDLDPPCPYAVGVAALHPAWLQPQGCHPQKECLRCRPQKECSQKECHFRNPPIGLPGLQSFLQGYLRIPGAQHCLPPWLHFARGFLAVLLPKLHSFVEAAKQFFAILLLYNHFGPLTGGAQALHIQQLECVH